MQALTFQVVSLQYVTAQDLKADVVDVPLEEQVGKHESLWRLQPGTRTSVSGYRFIAADSSQSGVLVGIQVYDGGLQVIKRWSYTSVSLLGIVIMGRAGSGIGIAVVAVPFVV